MNRTLRLVAGDAGYRLSQEKISAENLRALCGESAYLDPEVHLEMAAAP